MEKGVEIIQLRGLEGNKMKIAEMDLSVYPFFPQFIAMYSDFGSGAVMGFGAFDEVDQVLICISGFCMVKTLVNGRSEVFELNSPLNALYIKRGVWFEVFNFSNDAVVQVLYSRNPSEAKFVSNFNEYLRRNGLTY